MRALTLLSFLLLAACGQSGDLYLPPEQPAQPEQPAATPPPAETPPDTSTRGQAPADEDKKKEAPKEAR